jgi:hypothetical protein
MGITRAEEGVPICMVFNILSGRKRQELQQADGKRVDFFPAGTARHPDPDGFPWSKVVERKSCDDFGRSTRSFVKKL